jgi:hypothetical protein
MVSKIKSLFILFSIILIILVLQSCHQPYNDIARAVRSQLEQYPESTLQDIYKSFFQDEFGPGHLLNDTVGARKYMEYELSEMTSSGNHVAEPCGTGKNFYRMPLDLVKDGKVPFDIFFASFMESAASFRVPETAEWKVKWEQIVKVIESMDLEIENFEGDKKSLAEMLVGGETVVHHSEGYEKLYNPHYRIMGKRQWEKLQEILTH